MKFSKGLEIKDGVLCGKGTCTDNNIIIPDGVTKIGDNAFEGCPLLTFHGTKSSAAEQYAKKNNIPFEEKANHSYRHCR